jgi:hypothetical protein
MTNLQAYVVEGLEQRVLLAGEALDSTFGTGGILRLASTTSGGADAIAYTSDGKSVVAIAPDNNTDRKLYRYTETGAPDLSFGGTGRVSLPQVSSYSDHVVRSITELAGGVLSVTYAYGGADLNWYRAVAQFSASGNLLGLQPNVGGDTGEVLSTSAVRPNGNRVVLSALGSQITITQYLANSSLDRSFGVRGSIVTSLPGPVSGYSLGLKVGVDSKILVTASVNPSGPIDTTYLLHYAGFSVKSITATVGSQKKTSTDEKLSISDQNVFATPRSSGVMSIVADNPTSTSSAFQQGVRWAIARNVDDVFKTPTPQLTMNASDHLSVKLTLNGLGSFNVICYFDGNVNKKFDVGEELRVMHLAQVGVVLGSRIVTAGSAFSVAYPPGSVDIASGTGSTPAVRMEQTVTLRGGGKDGKIGVSHINLGWLQNGVGDTFAVTYADGKIGKEIIENRQTGARLNFPILDSARTSPGVGGDSAFLFNSTQSVLSAGTGTGEQRKITASDSPHVIFDLGHRRSGAIAVAASGSNDFRAYVAAYSQDFNEHYSTFCYASWQVIFTFSAVNGTFMPSGARVGYSVTSVTSGKRVEDLGGKTSGPTFTQSVRMDYP